MSTKESERVNEEGAIETTVETEDYRSSAGKGEAGREKIGVVHLRKKDAGGERPGVLAGATAAVSNTLESVKEGVMGKPKEQAPGSTETERVNEEGAIETTVETEDYRSSAGKGEAEREKIGVVHLRKKDAGGERPGVLAGTTAAVSNTLESVKEGVMGKPKEQAPGSTDDHIQ